MELGGEINLQMIMDKFKEQFGNEYNYTTNQYDGCSENSYLKGKFVNTPFYNAISDKKKEISSDVSTEFQKKSPKHYLALYNLGIRVYNIQSNSYSAFKDENYMSWYLNQILSQIIYYIKKLTGYLFNTNSNTNSNTNYNIMNVCNSDEHKNKIKNEILISGICDLNKKMNDKFDTIIDNYNTQKSELSNKRLDLNTTTNSNEKELDLLETNKYKDLLDLLYKIYRIYSHKETLEKIEEAKKLLENTGYFIS
jgi:hypothetical protein